MSTSSAGSMKNKWVKAFKSIKVVGGQKDALEDQGTNNGNGNGSPAMDAHIFQEYTYKKITPCDICSQILRGHTRQGMKCKLCRMNIHPDCQDQVPKCQPKSRLLRRQRSASELESRPFDTEDDTSNTSNGSLSKLKEVLNLNGLKPNWTLKSKGEGEISTTKSMESLPDVMCHPDYSTLREAQRRGREHRKRLARSMSLSNNSHKRLLSSGQGSRMKGQRSRAYSLPGSTKGQRSSPSLGQDSVLELVTTSKLLAVAAADPSMSNNHPDLDLKTSIEPSLNKADLSIELNKNNSVENATKLKGLKFENKDQRHRAPRDVFGSTKGQRSSPSPGQDSVLELVSTSKSLAVAAANPSISNNHHDLDLKISVEPSPNKADKSIGLNINSNVENETKLKGLKFESEDQRHRAYSMPESSQRSPSSACLVPRKSITNILTPTQSYSPLPNSHRNFEGKFSAKPCMDEDKESILYNTISDAERLKQKDSAPEEESFCQQVETSLEQTLQPAVANGHIESLSINLQQPYEERCGLDKPTTPPVNKNKAVTDSPTTANSPKITNPSESNSRNLGGSGHLQTIPAGDEDGLNSSQAGGPHHGTVAGVTRGSFVPNRPGVRIGGQFGGHPSQQQPLPRAINSTLNMDPAANLNSSSAPGTPPQSALKRAPRLNLRMKSISLDQPAVNSKQQQQQQAAAGSNVDSGGSVGSSSRGNSCSRWPGISATIASIRGGGPTLMQRTQRQGQDQVRQQSAFSTIMAVSKFASGGRRFKQRGGPVPGAGPGNTGNLPTTNPAQNLAIPNTQMQHHLSKTAPSSPVHNRRLLSARPTRMSSVELPDDNEKSVSSASTSPCPSPKTHRLLTSNLYVVLYNFKPRMEDELDLKAGFKLTVIDSSDKDWWKGKCLGSVGVFPSNYVTKINPGERPLQVTQTVQINSLSIQEPPIKLLRDQIVIQTGEDNGYLIIRTNEHKTGLCPMAYLQEV